MTQPFMCHQCADDGCNVPESEMEVCQTVMNCFKDSIGKFMSHVLYTRGCINTTLQFHDVCSGIKDYANYNSECCVGNFCNNGDFPSLRPSLHELPTLSEPHVEGFWYTTTGQWVLVLLAYLALGLPFCSLFLYGFCHVFVWGEIRIRYARWRINRHRRAYEAEEAVPQVVTMREVEQHV